MTALSGRAFPRKSKKKKQRESNRVMKKRLWISQCNDLRVNEDGQSCSSCAVLTSESQKAYSIQMALLITHTANREGQFLLPPITKPNSRWCNFGWVSDCVSNFFSWLSVMYLFGCWNCLFHLRNNKKRATFRTAAAVKCLISVRSDRETACVHSCTKAFTSVDTYGNH